MGNIFDNHPDQIPMVYSSTTADEEFIQCTKDDDGHAKYIEWINDYAVRMKAKYGPLLVQIDVHQTVDDTMNEYVVFARAVIGKLEVRDE